MHSAYLHGCVAYHSLEHRSQIAKNKVQGSKIAMLVQILLPCHSMETVNSSLAHGFLNHRCLEITLLLCATVGADTLDTVGRVAACESRPLWLCGFATSLHAESGVKRATSTCTVQQVGAASSESVQGPLRSESRCVRTRSAHCTARFHGQLLGPSMEGKIPGRSRRGSNRHIEDT